MSPPPSLPALGGEVCRVKAMLGSFHATLSLQESGTPGEPAPWQAEVGESVIRRGGLGRPKSVLGAGIEIGSTLLGDLG